MKEPFASVSPCFCPTLISTSRIHGCIDAASHTNGGLWRVRWNIFCIMFFHFPRQTMNNPEKNVCPRSRISEFRVNEFVNSAKNEKPEASINVSLSRRNSMSRGVGLKLSRKVVCGETSRTDALSFYDAVKAISQTPGVRVIWLRRALAYLHNTHRREENGEQLADTDKIIEWETRARQLNTADNNSVASSNYREKRAITVSPENGFTIPRISFGKLCATCAASVHATLLPRVLHIIVKNYGTGSIRELVFSDLSKL